MRTHRLSGPRAALAVFLTALGVLMSYPVSAQVSVSGPLTIEVEVLPGTTHSGTLVLENVGQRTEEVKLYQTDYRSESPNRSYYEDPGTHPRSNASWLTVTPLRFSIPPGTKYAVPYTIDVPVDAALSGSYWSVLMVEPVPSSSPESVAAPDGRVSVGVITVIRYAVRFVTHVGEAGTVNPEVTGVTLELRNAVPTLALSVLNAGTRMVRTEVWAELYDEAGLMIARRDGPGGTLFPDSSAEYQIPLADVPRGAYTALLLIDCGDNHVFGVSVSLSLQ